MLEELKNTQDRVVGLKQLLREIGSGRVERVFLAEDADAHVRNQVLAAISGKAVAFEPAGSMEELGRACGIDVGAACAGIIGK